MPSGPEQRTLDRQFSDSPTSSMDMDKFEGRKENCWFVNSFMYLEKELSKIHFEISYT